MKYLLHASRMKRATYYYNARAKADKYAVLRQRIAELFVRHHGRYGYRRICMALLSEGISVNHKTVYRLMHEMGLSGQTRKKRYRSYKGTVGRIAVNVLNRDFTADRPNVKWATDVSQIDINGHKCYLSPIIDMWNGEIVSYVISRSPNLAMVLTMLVRALKRVPTTEGLVLHSDQGWHYQHAAYQQMLAAHHITQSMSRKGNCLDNAMMEGFFGIMKKELLYARKFKNVEEFERELKKYINYYNNERIKLKLKMSPVKYRTLYENNNNKL